MFPPDIWNIHDTSQRWCLNQQHVRRLEQQLFNPVTSSIIPQNVWSRRRCCREAPNQAAVSFAMMLVSGGRNNKCQDTYRELFQSIVYNCHASNLQLNVQTIITYFGDAVLRAITAVFGRHINHQGCFYHLIQASWRKIQQLGLVPLCNNDDDFRRRTAWFCCLSLALM
jgi:hypothetical protein